jgi:hypothetical protein
MGGDNLASLQLCDILPSLLLLLLLNKKSG